MMERFYWRDEDVPKPRPRTGYYGEVQPVPGLSIYDRCQRQEPIAVCTDPDVAERITRLLNAEEALKKEPA